ncbi:hypothetical protein FRC10_006715 [Ceratobasidium sp. 414]|nr:hypothetical protein FRC10_006715 [Ceratobasidium sp. 414]
MGKGDWQVNVCNNELNSDVNDVSPEELVSMRHDTNASTLNPESDGYAPEHNDEDEGPDQSSPIGPNGAENEPVG